VFIFVSTNKLNGDRPNHLPFVELEARFEFAPVHPWTEHSIQKKMSIDSCLPGLFGASKAAAGAQEHSGAQLRGFLAYLVKCGITGAPYTVFGYKGKHVRDNIQSRDLVEAFW